MRGPHRPREAGGVCAGFIIAACGRWFVNGSGEAAIVCGRCEAPTGNVSDKHNAARTMVTVGRAPAAASRRRRYARANVRGSGGEAALPQHGRPSRAPRRRPPPCQRAAPRGPGGKGPKGQNLGHAQRHHWLMIVALVIVATPDAKRQRTCGRWRSEVFRAATCHAGGSGHPPASPGHARPNPRRAPAGNSSGRRTPPLRAVSRAASPSPRPIRYRGGRRVRGFGGKGRRGGAGFWPMCDPGKAGVVGRCGWRSRPRSWRQH
jgi:hypothetical protein